MKKLSKSAEIQALKCDIEGHIDHIRDLQAKAHLVSRVLLEQLIRRMPPAEYKVIVAKIKSIAEAV